MVRLLFLLYRQLEEDEDRFHKMQLTDQANFNDRLDTLQMVVAGMSLMTRFVTTLTDDSKANLLSTYH